MGERTTVVGLAVPTRKDFVAETPEEIRNSSHSPSERYLSTRGGDYGLSFEEVVLKGLASDGGLFIPEEMPSLPDDWKSKWHSLSFSELAYEILSLYISPSEIPPVDLKDIIKRSYSTFRVPETARVVTLLDSGSLHLLELFHGPTYAFQDVALQLLSNLFEYFLARKNIGKTGTDRHHLTVINATSGDTGSAAIYGLRGKRDVSVFILHPKEQVGPVQETQMTTVLDANVHNLAVEGTFDDCQDMVNFLFADPETNSTLNLATIDSNNFARILAQMTYYFHAYFNLVKSSSFKEPNQIHFVVPIGNFDLAGYFAKRMGLPVAKLVMATHENNILDRFCKTGYYGKKAVHGVEAHEGGAKKTSSPAVDVPFSGFERLLWFLAYEFAAAAGMNDKWTKRQAGQEVEAWLKELRLKGGFVIHEAMLEAARRDFESEIVSDEQIIGIIREFYRPGSNHRGGYILDPHSAIGIAAALKSMKKTASVKAHHIALATAHPAKSANTVGMALKDENGFNSHDVSLEEFVVLQKKEKRVREVPKGAGWQDIREIIEEEVKEELAGTR